MDANTLLSGVSWGTGVAAIAGMGAVLSLSAMGSGWGAGVAGMAAIGAWKKCFAQNKPASLAMLAFVGAPLTQTVYSMIVMNKMAELALKGHYIWAVGILSGIGMGASAMWQGMAGAAAADAMGETGKGFGQYMIVLGIIETVALFIMAFTLGVLGKLAA